nr:zinc finger, CCHC-type [Tanacetum cinerariifolium]
VGIDSKGFLEFFNCLGSQQGVEDLRELLHKVSKDDTAVAQRRLEDKQPEEKTNTDCLSEVAKHLGVARIQQQNGLVDETNVTLFAKMKTFIGSGVGTGSMHVLHGFDFEVELLEDHTFEVEPQENVDQGAGLQELQTQDLIDYQLALEKIYAHESLTFNNTIAREVISKWKARLKDDMDARSDVYVLSNGCRKCNDNSDNYYSEYAAGMIIHLFLYIDGMVFSCGCKVEIRVTKGLLVKAMGNVLGLEITGIRVVVL